MASAINAMAGAFHEQAWQQIESLETMATKLEQAAKDPVSTEVAHELRELALRSRQRHK